MKTKALWLFAVAMALSACGEGGGCGAKEEEEAPKNCPSGSTWNAERKVCLEPNGTPRAPLN